MSNWNNITVQQYQQLLPILEQKDSTDFDKLVRMICIVTKKKEAEVDSWSLNQLRQFRFLFKLDFENKIPKYIDCNGKRYKFVSDIRRMPAARYVESKTFVQEGLIPNLHRLMASCVLPMRRTWYGRWVEEKYNAADHSTYAEDLLQAPFPQVYNACLFFCLLFTNWIKASQTFLKAEAEQVMSKEEAETLFQSLTDILDGLTPQPL